MSAPAAVQLLRKCSPTVNVGILTADLLSLGSEAPDFRGENAELLQAMDWVSVFRGAGDLGAESRRRPPTPLVPAPGAAMALCGALDGESAR